MILPYRVLRQIKQPLAKCVVRAGGRREEGSEPPPLPSPLVHAEGQPLAFERQQSK